MALSHNLGFPRIGNFRQLKFAVEKYWRKAITAEELTQVANEIKQQKFTYQQKLDIQQAGDFTFYDHVLDTSVLLGVIPERYEVTKPEPVSLDNYFRIARGQAPTGKDVPAGEMTKWFNTNYHFIVPEIEEQQDFYIANNKLFTEVEEAVAKGYNTKAVLLGPLTWLYLAKAKNKDFNKLTLLPKLITIYQEILTKLGALNASWIQLDEPILVLDLDKEWQAAFTKTYQALAEVKINKLIATYFGQLHDNLELATSLPVEGLHVDVIGGNELEAIQQKWPTNKVLSVGIINGRNVWKNNLRQSLQILKPIAEKYQQNLWIAPSCSLLHSPVDLASEQKLAAETKSWFAFAAQKIEEVTLLTKAINLGEDAIATELAESDRVVLSRQQSTQIHNPDVIKRVKNINIDDDCSRSPYPVRAKLQQELLNLPLYPTTTIGSFPQTTEIRKIRSEYKQNKISFAEYQTKIRQEIAHVIKVQEELDIDVLVHGEPERNDMVEYFGELLANFAITEYGWVQSYGSRCVKPPIIIGDVWHQKAMTVDWIKYAQSLTNKYVKGMLTGPVTILSWSFKREDISYADSAKQIALAILDEVKALEQAGIKIIQVDEPAFRELLPLRKAEQEEYLTWAEQAFRLATSKIEDSTQIHTHMCYSEFNEIIQHIANLDADVITIETSRSNMELLDAFKEFNYPNEIGPGVYDIHSPRIPTKEEIKNLLLLAASRLPKEQIWVNPDCGLKTRQWPETKAALQILVDVAKELRA